MDVKLKPHYWIYSEGKEVWNQWMNPVLNKENNNIRDFSEIDDDIKKRILDNIEANCQVDVLLPKPSDEINFKETHWYEIANFEEFIFKSQVNFEDAIFKESCIFMGADFQHRGLFAKAVFHKQASFVNSKVNMLISFYQCEFNLEAPFINGIETKGIINFDGCIWPELPDEPKYKKEMNDEEKKKTEIDRDVYFKKISNYKNAYCYLKSSMNDRDIHDMEIIFFRLELEAKSKLETTTVPTKFLIWLYGKTSGYGDGSLKPFIYLLLSAILFTLIYISFPSIDSWMISSKISLANLFPFVTPNKTLYTEVIDLRCLSELETLLFNVARGIQIILSIILIFLMVLGLRNKLRLK